MKKIAFLILAILPFAASACNAGKNVSRDRMMSLVREYEGKEGFEVVTVGNLGMGLMKMAAGFALDDNDMEHRLIRETVSGISGLAVIDYGDSDTMAKERFNMKAEKILERAELLMAVNDAEDKVMIYGVMDEDGSIIRNFVLFSPGDALICLFGKIPMEPVMKIIEEEYDR